LAGHPPRVNGGLLRVTSSRGALSRRRPPARRGFHLRGRVSIVYGTRLPRDRAKIGCGGIGGGSRKGLPESVRALGLIGPYAAVSPGAGRPASGRGAPRSSFGGRPVPRLGRTGLGRGNGDLCVPKARPSTSCPTAFKRAVTPGFTARWSIVRGFAMPRPARGARGPWNDWERGAGPIGPGADPRTTSHRRRPPLRRGATVRVRPTPRIRFSRGAARLRLHTRRFVVREYPGGARGPVLRDQTPRKQPGGGRFYRNAQQSNFPPETGAIVPSFALLQRLAEGPARGPIRREGPVWAGGPTAALRGTLLKFEFFLCPAKREVRPREMAAAEVGDR